MQMEGRETDDKAGQTDGQIQKTGGQMDSGGISLRIYLNIYINDYFKILTVLLYLSTTKYLLHDLPHTLLFLIT